MCEHCDGDEVIYAYLDFNSFMLDPTCTVISLEKHPYSSPVEGNVRIKVAIPIPKEAMHAVFFVKAKTRAAQDEPKPPPKNLLV